MKFILSQKVPKRLFPSRSVLSFASLSLLSVLASQSVPAATLYWDLNGTPANSGSSATGAWNGTNLFWNTDSSGTGGTPQAGTTNADDLIFSSGTGYTSGGTITLSGARAASSITFEENAPYSLTGGTSLTIGGTGAAAFDGIRVSSGANAANSIGTPLILSTGTNTIQTAGTGVLNITGGITGTQNLILDNASTNSAGITISGTSLNNTGTLTNSGSGTGGALISAVIGTNVTSVTQNGTSPLTLSGANLYTGDTTITSGVLRAANSAALGATTGNVSIASGATLELSGGIAIAAGEDVTLDGTGVNGGGGIRNVLNANSIAGSITLANTAAHRIDSYINSGTLTLSGALGETGTTVKTLSFGGGGATSLTGTGSSNSVLNITKDGIGSLTTSNTALRNLSNGTVTIRDGTLNLDYTSTTNLLGDGSILVLGGGTVNRQNGSHTETVASTTINAGATNITRSSGTSVLRMNAITRNAGGIVNFGGAGIADTDTTNTNGILGPWATVGGLAYAFNSTNAANGAINALASYGQAVTRLTASKVINNNPTFNVQITDGTGAAADITLAAATTTINTLTNNATGGASTINPNNQTLRVAGVLNPSTAGALTIGNGTNNDFLASNASGGELVLQNFSTTNDLTINSVIANNTSASSLTVAGTGNRNGTFTSTYVGRTILTGANSYTGATYVSSGTLQIGNGGATGSLSPSSAITTNGTLAFDRDSITQGSGFSSVISGRGNVSQVGSGTLFLNGTNTYTGVTTFDAGIVNVSGLTNYGVAGPLGNRAFSDETVTEVGLYFEGGTLQYTGSTPTSTDRFIRVGLGANAGTIDASGTGSGTMSFTNTSPNVDPWANAGTRTLTLTGSNTGDNVFGINIQQHAGATSLVKNGAGTWVLNNAHNSDAVSTDYSAFGGYGGGTTVSGGTLAFVDGAIGGGAVNVTGNSTLRWQPGSTMDISTGTGAGVARTLGMTGAVTATLNTNGNNVTLSGAITGAGGGGITKAGAGTLMLSSTANSYTGTTTIQGGTLLLGNDNVIPDASAVTLSGGTLHTGGFDDTAGVFSLTTAATKILDMGHIGASLLNFFSTDTSLWTGALHVWNWTGTVGAVNGTDQIDFGSFTGPDTFNLSQVRFYAGAGTYLLGNGAAIVSNELIPTFTPVPETSTVAGILALVGLIGWRERRYFLRCPEAVALVRARSGK